MNPGEISQPLCTEGRRGCRTHVQVHLEERAVTRGRLDRVYWALPSKSRGTSAGGRGRESVTPCWTLLQIPLPCWISFSSRRAWFSGGLWTGSCGGPLLLARGRFGARGEQRRERCPSPHSAGVGDTRHKAGQGVGPTRCSQFRGPSWSLVSPRTMSSTGQSCRSWDGWFESTFRAREGHTAPLGPARLSLGVGALGTWNGSNAGESTCSGSGPGAPHLSSEKWGDPGTHGDGWKDPGAFRKRRDSIGASLETLSTWADLALGRREKLLPS